jgi:hypothetical protein
MRVRLFKKSQVRLLGGIRSGCGRERKKEVHDTTEGRVRYDGCGARCKRLHEDRLQGYCKDRLADDVQGSKDIAKIGWQMMTQQPTPLTL